MQQEVQGVLDTLEELDTLRLVELHTEVDMVDTHMPAVCLAVERMQ